MRYHELLREGQDNAGWWRGISKQDADNIRQGVLPQPSAVPIAMYNEVMDHLGYDDDEAWELQKELEGEEVINVTSDEQNAEGYGDEVLWFERHLIDMDLKHYGLINIATLQRLRDSWGLRTPWEPEAVTEDTEDAEYDARERKVHALLNKYVRYYGCNHDGLPGGYAYAILDTGIPSDGIEYHEFHNFLKKRGLDNESLDKLSDEEEYDKRQDEINDAGLNVVFKYPDEFPVTNAFLKDLYSIYPANKEGYISDDAAQELYNISQGPY